ncbi:MAG: PAS domain-containing protein, partial [Bacteroidota bacterium]
ETFIHPEDRSVVETIKAAIANDEGYNVDYRIFTKNGVLKWINNHAKVVCNEANEPVRLDGVLKDITERKKAEYLFQAKQQQLEDVFDSMEEVVWSRRISDRSFIFVSPSVYKVFGVTQEAFLEDPDLWKKMSHPDDQAVIGRIRAQSRTVGSFDEEYRIIATDGTVKWVNHRGQLSFDEMGNPIVLSGLFKDISSKKKAEIAVKEGREKYRNLFHYSVVGKIKLDFKTRQVLESNPAIEKLLGYTSEEFLELSMEDLSPGNYQEVDHNTREQLKEFGRSIGVQKHYMHRDGTPIPVLVSAFMMEEDGKKVVWSNVQDYRRVYEQNKALEESESRLEMALNVTMAGTWDTNLLGETADYDERWANILGLDPETVKSTGYELWLSLLHPEDSERVRAAAGAHVAGETSTYEAEYRLKHQDGHYIWVKERGKVVEWTTEGRPSRMVGTLLDISSEKQAMSKLEQSEADLRETQRTTKIGSWLYNSLTNRYELSAIACEIYGLPENTALDYEELVRYFHPDDQQAFKDANFDIAVGFEHRVVIKDELRWVFVKSEPYNKDGSIYTHKGIIQDITDRKQVEESLREQELRFRTFIENASDL